MARGGGTIRSLCAQLYILPVYAHFLFIFLLSILIILDITHLTPPEIKMESSDNSEKLSMTKPIVLVLGLTGAGKSTFINTITRSESVAVGDKYISCTEKPVKVEAEIDGVKVDFLDTPGFADTGRSDAEILHSISEWIGENLGGQRKVTAALYLLSVDKVRLQRSDVDNFLLFRELVGSNNMSNVGLVTTKWNTVSKDVAEAREAELISPGGKWRPMILQGATTYRMDKNYETGYDLVRRLLRTDPLFIKLQQEMAPEFEGKLLSKTAAGQTVLGDLNARTTNTRKTIKGLENVLATGELNPESSEEFQKNLKEMEALQEQLTADRKLVEHSPGWGQMLAGLAATPDVRHIMITGAICYANAVFQRGGLGWPGSPGS